MFFSDSRSPPLHKAPLCNLVTENIDAGILNVWQSLSPPLPKVPLRYLVTRYIDAHIIIVCHSVSTPLPKVPLRYLVTQNKDMFVLYSFHVPLPKIPVVTWLPSFHVVIQYRPFYPNIYMRVLLTLFISIT